ncbi:hypothetical protein HYH02_002532 [Chlamydomonas schloesseri]|uniref:Uncharacterized protein n=1 Tax=Chlamydomonas schloesseri TaxID=2026947 RepID=A0A835WS71_9CHLO|nr:hypothetical protein HYH02_002532 [Chlamydomonas schloesseri]|eukprot:KAG2453209.1 hypothetical protein HYH02_002532 [Chlamydomonas schloesseri]
MNLGPNKGAVALIKRSTGKQVFLIQCMSHILHNALLTACKVAFGPDPTKLFFFLEQLAAFGADSRPHLRAYGIKYICPVPTDSRWDSYTYTAMCFVFILFNYSTVLRMARDLGKIKNAELVDKLFDGEYIIVCTIVVVWGHVIGTPEFLYIESGGAFHMSHIHARIRRTKAMIVNVYAEHETKFKLTYETAVAHGKTDAAGRLGGLGGAGAGAPLSFLDVVVY